MSRSHLVIGVLAITGALVACGMDDDAPGTGEDPAGTASGTAEASLACAASAADEVTAAAMAKACGSTVEVESARTAFSELRVESSGIRTLVAALAPQRARRRDGTWGALDTTLERVSGVIAPRATAANVRFSGGGTTPLVSVTHEGRTFTLSWPTSLPAPTLAGDSATYAQVLPDVDLVVTATPTGFTHLLVVKTARAAANPAVRQARYRIGGDTTMKVTPEGGLVAEGDGSARVVSAEPPTMWDTPGPGVGFARNQSDAIDALSKVARVGAAVSAGHLVLTADTAMLDDPGAKFPLIIDPPWHVGQHQWAYATITNTNGQTTDTKISIGDPSPAAPELRVGNDPGSSHQFRSFMRFPIHGVAGTKIISAKIVGRVDHTWKCTSRRPTFFFRTAPIAAAPRQSWPGPALQLLVGNNNVFANEQDCSDANMGFEVSTTTLLNDVQAFASAGEPNYYVGISAGENTAGTNETDQERWMRYFLNDFQLQISYNTRPDIPTDLTVDGKPCVSGPTRPIVKTLTPTLRARVTDRDNDSLEVWYLVSKWDGSAFVPATGTFQRPVPSGGTAVFVVPSIAAMVDGGIYTWRAQANDLPSHVAAEALESPVTHVPGNCEWEADIAPPAVPTVTSDVYHEGPSGCPGGACGSVGQTGRFTFSSSSDTRSFLWGFSDPPTTVATPQGVGGSVTVDFTPTSSGPRTLFVRAIDGAGNESTRVYQFVVAAESPALARWLMNAPAGSTQVGDDTGHGFTLPLTTGVLGVPGRIVPGPDGASRSALQLSGVVAGVRTAGPVLADTSRSFSVSAWVKLTDSSRTRKIVEQVAPSGGVAFLLEYEQSANVWKLTAPAPDGTAFPGVVATSTPRLNTWTHLAGTYDSSARTMKLYVNGVLEGTQPGITTWNATGFLRIGREWVGSLAEIQVWNRVISATEAFALADPIAVARVGDWRMGDIGSTQAIDSSDLAHDLTLWNGASIPSSGTGLRLDGVNDDAATAGPVLYTDQSFTVSVRARPTTTAVDQTFVTQQSTGAHGGFSLGFGRDGGVWRFRIHASPTDAANPTIAAAPAVNPTTAFHQLVGVFDAQRREIRLYVDGVLRATAPMAAAWQPWNATDPLVLGRHHSGVFFTEHTAGDLDEVRVYQGAVTDVTRIP
jgi:hypothetical protein